MIEQQRVQIVDYVPRKETVSMGRRTLLAALREAAAEGTEFDPSDHFRTRSGFIHGIVDRVLSDVIEEMQDPESYNKIVDREWSRTLVKVDHPRRAIDACENILLAAKPEIDVERAMDNEPGWWIRRRDLTAFIGVEEAVTLTIPAFVDLVTERLNAAKAA